MRLPLDIDQTEIRTEAAEKSAAFPVFGPTPIADQTHTDPTDPSTHDQPTSKEGDEVMSALVQRQEWEDHALCRDVTDAGQVFFSEDLGDIAAAKRVCADCPVLASCLESAIERAEPWGVWGGQLFLNGKALASKRGRGRPPKVPRPEEQLPVVPIPVHLRERISVA